MKKLDPFNIELMFAPDSTVRQFRPTTVTDIYDGISSNFHENGLFSVTTFGRVGSPERDTRFSYIKLNAQVIHPAVFEILKKLKRLYVGIIMGTDYAVWNPKTKDFESSDMIDGDTGYAFFVRHIHHLEPDKRASKKRNMYVDIFEKYKKDCLMHNCLVIPAGMRDLYIDGNGREVQDEINDLYRKLLIIASSINEIGAKQNDPAVDQPRKNLQLTMNEIYNYLKTMLEGKKGLIQQKWGGRKIVNGTRNVISMMETLAEDLSSPRAPKVDDVQIGLYQTIKGASPIAIHGLKTKFLNHVFTDPNYDTELIDKKTLKKVSVNLNPETWDKWGTVEGLEKLIDGFADDRLRNRPISIQGHYLYLVYRRDDVFKLFRDIDELPSEEYKQYVHPLTYAEFFYLAGYETYYDKLRAIVVRYPIDSVYSAHPSKVYVKTNIDAKGAYELDDDWVAKIGYAREYPDTSMDNPWVNTAVIHPSKLSELGADSI